MEIHYGLYHNPQRAKKIKKLIDDFLRSIAIIDFTEEEALHAAKIRAHLRKRGTPIGSYDILIAATALHHDLILVTSNTKEFDRVSKLEIENWRGA